MSAPFRVGVDYYPEQWDEDRWSIDAQLMREAGFNLVRLAEFAWAKLEPELLKFDFAWLDRAIAILQAHGLEVVLGTPTATPPPWLYASNPEQFRVLPDGRRVTFGHRRGYSPSHPEYLEHSKRIVTAMAEHYAKHPAVIGWQIDNEFGDRDYSPAAQTAFQEWLKRKHGTLEALNAAWGTVFWSQTYSEWSQIPVPLETAAPHNPGLALDFARFSSQAYVRFQAVQLEILRRLCPDHFVTHNLMGFGYDQIDYFDLAADLDFVTWDNYPRIWWNINEGDDPARAALSHATMRGLKNAAFWVMEQQSGAGGWEYVVPHPKPGELRLWAYQAIAHGANGIVFFRFRTARHGSEQYWHGLLEHDGTPGRRYQEAKRFGLEIKEIGTELLESQPRAKVAIALSYESRFALQIQANNPNLSYSGSFKRWYDALHSNQIGTDIVPLDGDLSRYRLLIAPLLHVVTATVAANLERYVRAGGTLVLGFRSGVKDEHNAIIDAPLPGLLRGIAGVRVEEYDSLYPQTRNEITLALDNRTPKTIGVETWCDVLESEGAERLGTYMSAHYAGRAAITRHRLGHGEVIYVGTTGPELEPELIAWFADRLELRSSFNTVNGVEIVERQTEDKRLVFIMNHSSETKHVAIPASASSLFDSAPHDGFVLLEAFGVHVLRSKLDASIEQKSEVKFEPERTVHSSTTAGTIGNANE